MRFAAPRTLAALAITFCSLLGCGRQGRVQVYPVEGRLTVGGRPAANAMLAFHPLAGSASGIPLSVATTGADGTYRLTTYDVGDGAAEAEYAVTVVWPDDSLPRDECAEPTAHDRLGCRYADPAKSKLRATVVPGRNEVPLRASLGSSWSLPKMRDLERK